MVGCRLVGACGWKWFCCTEACFDGPPQSGPKKKQEKKSPMGLLADSPPASCVLTSVLSGQLQECDAGRPAGPYNDSRKGPQARDV